MKTAEEILKMHTKVIYNTDSFFDLMEDDEKALVLKSMEEYANQFKQPSLPIGEDLCNCPHCESCRDKKATQPVFSTEVEEGWSDKKYFDKFIKEL